MLGGLSRRAALKAGIGGLAAASFVRIDRSFAQEAEITVQYDWLMGNSQIGDIVAQKKGYYADAGLSVTFSPGGPNAQTVAPVVAGQALLAQFSSTGQAMIARGGGVPLKVFACSYRTAPFGFYSLPRAPIRSVQDMVGKRIGIQPTARFVLDILLQRAKIDPSTVEIVNMGWDMTPLVSGQTDAVTGWITNTSALSIIGPDRIDLMMGEAGLPDYGNPFFALEDAIDEKADILGNYLVANSRGWAWAYENRAEAVDIMCDAYPDLDRAIEHQTVDAVMKLTFDAATKEHGWGWFELADIQTEIDLYAGAGQFSGAVPTAEEMTTFAILEATADKRAKIG